MEAAPAALPDDAIAEVLCRLPMHTIALCRFVCKAWRAVVDDRGLLLPRALRGIFLNLVDYDCPRFFARRLSSSSERRPCILGNLGFLPSYRDFGYVLDHCNGLLLYDGGYFEGKLYVVNPATRRWDCLPPRTEDDRRYPRRDLKHYVAYLVFDPAVLPHYEVVLIPRIPMKPRIWPPEILMRSVREAPPSPVSMRVLFSTSSDDDELMEESSEPEDPYRWMIWPPSPYMFHVFSSRTGRWEERSFVREGDVVGTVEDARPGFEWKLSGPRCGYGVYWQGTLYVHCSNAFVIRISLTNCTYQVIKTPTMTKEIKHVRYYLGRSEKGVYLATVENYSQLRVWILHESHGQISWVLKHHNVNIFPYVWRARQKSDSFYGDMIDGSWILEDEDYNDNDNAKMLEGGDYEWDSDKDVDEEDGDVEHYIHDIGFLGFHPYKEIVFLNESFIGIAYNLNTSKVQYLGKLRPDDYYYTHCANVYESFPYTPCMTGAPLRNPSS